MIKMESIFNIFISIIFVSFLIVIYSFSLAFYRESLISKEISSFYLALNKNCFVNSTFDYSFSFPVNISFNENFINEYNFSLLCDYEGNVINAKRVKVINYKVVKVG